MNRLRNKSILIIDDDTAMLRALEKVLVGEGATITTSIWAGDALKIMTDRKKKFDLVITDLRMPYVTGMTMVYAIRRLFPTIPVIVLTAFSNPDVKVECLRLGAATILEKPLDTRQLIMAFEVVFALQEAGEWSSWQDINEEMKVKT